MPPIVLINAVGLTPRLLEHAPRLKALADGGWYMDMPEVLPAVTCTAQATLLTGTLPNKHGVVANGWLFNSTNEVRFWQQCNRLVQAEPVYETARRRAAERGVPFKSAKLFWWFNQGAAVDISVTPKPHYAVNGDKAFGIAGTPPGVAEGLERVFGPFPFPSFWGPMAGLPATEWIASAAANVLQFEKPDLTLVYLPHLDYDPQRFGPSGCDMRACVKELDDACAPIFDAAKEAGAQIWVVSEYGHCDVSRPVYLNRALREAELLEVRPGPFGEQLDLYGSRAFAVVDHQVAHVYLRNPAELARVRAVLAEVPGVAKLLAGEEIAEIGLNHQRSGALVLLAEPDAWFAYPFWLDDDEAPDYARAVAIHHKPGFDPCELFFDPRFRFPKLHAARKLVQKKLGFRTTFDVVPLDAGVVRGSHGLAAADPLDRPILIGHGPMPAASVPMTQVKDMLLAALELQ
ncbi:Type I phosphodiesterase / nucleotide pyrophosphatase [Gemmata obscuriglobus]|uniref:Alkaline phosphatase family protein n=1 Tax=Gemmata obscuriglobus TaxID=114 RepID=A0A2Z3HHY8_9BACT|nr:nucleotide pyrophosphatase/phosphodiesterase family protein [Gemmata obscuriglobus]AWM41434.1 alkaline phosphatase family protein [Gemmata obscuriglobus]QEG32660.1 Type I phosphodiesterase / nucleotide pyrophosphatase [Gemmata obscuriglobus]VTS12016.1 phosphodiesterase : Putative AP superfamily protein OS=Singulisphaera acidiphila (strain ATCC BAA-1392 / DSM 18658 / VKM B-2454 / MOB10) GN=Sinac_5186 PE=4 SV=1: Phosphodiest [Gemmata obscuriglobus UQM 2246]